MPVSLVAAAVCAHPPLIVPDLAGAAASELDSLRAACDTAVGRLLTAAPDTLTIVGDGPVTRQYTAESYGTLAPWGVPVEAFLDRSRTSGVPDLSLSVTIGAWLLGRHHHPVRVTALSVAPDASPQVSAALGADLTDLVDRADRADRVGLVRSERVALLVMGDGSACRGPQSPGYDDPRAEAFDGFVAKALADADTTALMSIDPDLARELHCAGRASWQVLAGAAAATAGTLWRGALHYDDAPYGVGYFVASWEPA